MIPAVGALPQLDEQKQFTPDFLAKCILGRVGKSGNSATKQNLLQQLRGLVVIAGETGSGKSTLADGLLRRFLTVKAALTVDDKIADQNKGLPPIQHVVALGRPVDWEPYNRYKPGDYKTIEEFEPETDLHCYYKAYGIQYTPRTLGIDATLESALVDALRQKPAAVYLDEIREDRDWPAVLRFAQTGHLIITTAHAGSVQDLIAWVLKSMGVQNRSQSPAVVQNIIAVIHVDPLGTENKSKPELWIGKRGAQMLGAYGLGALVAAADKEAHFIERKFLTEQIDKSRKMQQSPPNGTTDPVSSGKRVAAKKASPLPPELLKP